MNKKLKLEELNRASVEEFKSKSKYPVVLVLDNIRSFNNVGSCFRTADALALEKIYLCGITAKPPHREIHKTALGATDSVAWEYVANTEDAIAQLKTQGYQVVSVEQTEKTTLLQDFDVDPNKKYALVVGNEVKGVGQAVIDASDVVLEIPQFGTKHSFNVSVCTGIVCWELVKGYFKA